MLQTNSEKQNSPKPKPTSEQYTINIIKIASIVARTNLYVECDYENIWNRLLVGQYSILPNERLVDKVISIKSPFDHSSIKIYSKDRYNIEVGHILILLYEPIEKSQRNYKFNNTEFWLIGLEILEMLEKKNDTKNS